MNGKDLETLILCSFRYSLGRKTYITSEIASLIIKYEDKLKPWIKERICHEIAYSLKINQIGMNMDKEEWMKLLKHLDKNNNISCEIA